MATDPVPAAATRATWSAPVRYAEADQQGIVFNAHYLTWADEAMGAFCDQRGLREVSERVKLVSSRLSWAGSARWGDVVEVAATCTRLGGSSFDMTFVVHVGAAECCRIETTYVLTGADDRPARLPDHVRAALTSDR